MLEEHKRLNQIIQTTKRRLNQAPEGRLRISKSNGHVQYYWCKAGEKTGTYIPKKEEEIVRALAQKQYDEKVLRLAEPRYVQIEKILKSYEDDEINRIYLKENKIRQEKIIPVEPTWEQIIKEWLEKEYQPKGFREGTPIILTERGERVRSKSEKIMADYFHRHGIAYKYEAPIYLKGIGTVYPDFTFLSPKNRKEIYWEHCGKVDDPEYARGMVRKMNAYENNELYIGERLILTFETENTILNTTKIEQIVKRYLI